MWNVYHVYINIDFEDTVYCVTRMQGVIHIYHLFNRCQPRY